MGCNYYLYKKDGSNWILPANRLGNLIEFNAFDCIKKDFNSNTFELDYKRCITEREGLHIGKSSFGWHFNLCIYPYMGIYNLEDWKRLFNSDNYIIKDEYEEKVSVDEMLDIITNRSVKEYTDFIEAHKEEFISSSHSRYLGLLPSEKYSLIRAYERDVIEELNKLAAETTSDHIFGKLKTYNSYDELLKENHAERGLNGLWAHKSTITDNRDDPAWKGFIPIISTYIRTDGTYDLTPDWDFS